MMTRNTRKLFTEVARLQAKINFLENQIEEYQDVKRVLSDVGVIKRHWIPFSEKDVIWAGDDVVAKLRVLLRHLGLKIEMRPAGYEVRKAK